MRSGGALVAAAALAALGGCATGPPLEARLQAWIGRSEGELVSAFGVPERTYEVEGRKFLQYEERRTQLVPGDPLRYGWPYRRYYGPAWAPPAYVVRQCDVTFALRKGVVESFSFRGDGCR